MKRFVVGFLAALVFTLVAGAVFAQEGSAPTASSSYVEMPPVGGDSWSFLPEVEPTAIYSVNFEDSALSDWKLESSDASLMWGIGWAGPMMAVLDFNGAHYSTLNYSRFHDFYSAQQNAVSAKSPVIDAAGYSDRVLKFKCAYGVMGEYNPGQPLSLMEDRRFARIHSADGTLLSTVQLLSPQQFTIPGLVCEMGQWHEHQIPLPPDGEKIRIEFRVETDSGILASWTSWSVDDVVVEGTAKPAESAVAAAEESKPENAAGGGSCGCVGAEAILLLGILAVGRKRKQNS